MCNPCNYSIKCQLLSLLIVGKIEVRRAYIIYLDLQKLTKLLSKFVVKLYAQFHSLFDTLSPNCSVHIYAQVFN